MEDITGRKSLKVSTAAHERVHQLATRLGTNADGVLKIVLDEAFVHIPLTDDQRARWVHAARCGGMSLEDFVKTRVEAALLYDADPTALYGMDKKLDRILAVLPRPVQTFEVQRKETP